MPKAVNKVIYGNQTIVDMTDATASSSDILLGKTAYGASGEKITGTCDYDTLLVEIADLEDRMGFPGAAYESEEITPGLLSNLQDRIGYPNEYSAEEEEENQD